MISIRFSEFLRESDSGVRPFFKASAALKDSLNKYDANSRKILIDRINAFKGLKSTIPQDLIPSPKWKDHALRGTLSRYYEAHLVYGKVCLIYYHGGKYIILVDIVPHSVLENKGRRKELETVFDRILEPVKTYVESRLSYNETQKDTRNSR